MAGWATADLCDHFEGEIEGGSVQVCEPIFKCYGGVRSFHGPIQTVRAIDDNSLVRAELETDGKGRVLVVDGNGSLRCALVGDNLAALAITNHWAGLIVNGCVRDTAVMENMQIGARALNSHPKKSVKRNTGEVGVIVEFAGVAFQPGNYVYADADGILVSTKELHCAP